MKRILGIAFALCLLGSPALATCPTTLQLKDNAGVTPTAKYTDDGAGNCMANVAVIDGGEVTIGAKADAKNAATDTTPITAMSVWKQISASIQAAASSLASLVTGQSTGNTSLATIATNTGAAIPTQAVTVPIGGVTNDPCQYATKTNAAIATSSGTVQLVAPSGSTQVYVCSFSLIAASTAVVNLVGGTGATCTTGTPVAAVGSTTAASGMSLAANGGLTFGNGGATATRTTTAGHGLCLIQSGTTALAGNIAYVQQ